MRNTPSALLTDLYELTMAAGYLENGMNHRAVFELYCHTLPKNRSFLVAAGLATAVDYLAGLRFTPADIRYLKSLPVFKHVNPEFFHYLRDFRFTGNVWAMREGEICFAGEPLIQVEAPIIEAQIVETFLLAAVNLETLVASKAARVVAAAESDGVARPVVDFGSRRAHGPAAGTLAARSSYIAGCLGSSNVLAGERFGIPVFGTMAHSWVQAFDKEEEAFRAYHKIFPEHAIFLVDTYDTVKGAQKAVDLKIDFRGVRLDSGNLLALSRQVRALLDRSGHHAVKIVASGNLDEYKIARLVKQKAPIDFFGVGTEMVTSGDAPSLDLTYKLVETKDEAGKTRYTAKLSQGKQTRPGRKQVFRTFDKKGMMVKDTLALAGEKPPSGAKPLLRQVMAKGQLVKPLPDTRAAREHFTAVRKKLLKSYFFLSSKESYPVELGFRLQVLLRKIYRAKSH